MSAQSVFGVAAASSASGAIYTQNATTITACTFTGNGGCGAIDNLGALTVSDSTFVGNRVGTLVFGSGGRAIDNKGTASAATDIERSPETRDHLLRSWYLAFLGRQAANGEGWAG